MVYGNVGHVRIVSCELVMRLIQVFGTLYSCLDLIPMCMSAGVQLAMHYYHQVTPPFKIGLTYTLT